MFIASSLNIYLIPCKTQKFNHKEELDASRPIFMSTIAPIFSMAILCTIIAKFSGK